MRVPRLFICFWSLTAWLFLQGNTGFAQHQAFPVFGLELGVGASSLQYDNPSAAWDVAGRASFSGMAFTILPLAKPIYVQTGLRIHNFGNDVGTEAIDDGDGELVNFNFQITQNYLSVPARLHVALGKRGLYVMAGAEAGYLLSASISRRFEGSLNEDEASITDTLNRWNVAFSTGFGYLIEVVNGQIYFQGQFSRGLTGVADTGWISDWVTQEMLFTVGLIF